MAVSSPLKGARAPGSRCRRSGFRSASQRSASMWFAPASPAARPAQRRCARRSSRGLPPTLAPPGRRSCSPPPAWTTWKRRSSRPWPGGAWVVSDRFADSTRAYQGAAGNLPPEFIATLERLTIGATRPDLTLILDLAPEVGLERASKRRGGKEGADRFESEGLAFHQTLRRAFLDIAAAEPRRCAVIDASKRESEVAAAIWSAVETRLDPAGALVAHRT